MAFQILLNFFLAALWMFFESTVTLSTFIVGYLLGLLIIFVMRRFFNTRFYLYRVFAVIWLTILFLKELVLSNLAVLRIVLKPKLDIKPGIFAFETELESEWEVTLLSSLITLTPGTLVVDVSDDNKVLYIHSMDIEDVDEAAESIKLSFEKAISEVSR